MPVPSLSRTDASLKATIAGMSCQTDVDMFVRSMLSWGHISNMTFQPLNSGIGINLSRVRLDLEGLGASEAEDEIVQDLPVLPHLGV